MEAKFTKGEWFVDNDGYFTRVSARQEFGNVSVCTLPSGRSSSAHLIAAAPDMYELIERIGKADQVWSMEEIQELLTKARGES